VRKIIITTGVLVLAVLGIWYFFVRSYDYVVTFSVPTNSPSLYYRILESEQLQKNTDKSTAVLKLSGPNSQLIKSSPFNEINQQLLLNEESYILNWRFNNDQDQTRVKLGIKSVDHSKFNRFQYLLGRSGYKAAFGKKAKGLISDLKEYYASFRLDNSTVNPKIAKTYYISQSLSSSIPQKAGKMMESVLGITKYLSDNDFTIDSNPFSIIDEIDIKKNSIDFRFCFPVSPKDLQKIRSQNRYSIDSLEVNEFESAKYFGNYATTNEAWYSMLGSNPVETINNNYFIETYLNNPHEGGDDTQWEALIYMIKK